MIFTRVISCIIFISLITGENDFPCPFNERECNCTADPSGSPLVFFMAQCKSLSGIPSFVVPSGDQRYRIADHLRIFDSDIKIIHPRHFSAFRSIQSLILEQRTQETPSWDEKAFDGVEINSITIDGLNDMVPPPKALVRLGSSGLKSLTIRNADNATLTDNVFEDFSSLNRLSIDQISIAAIRENAFRGLENHLDRLELVRTSLTEVPSALNSGLRNLKILDLSGNSITKIKPHTFSVLVFPGLIALRLAQNKIAESIDEGALDDLPPNMESLNLDETGLSAVPKRILDHLSELTGLTLKGNLIEKLQHEDLQNNQKLVELILSDNPIPNLDDDDFSPLKSMRYLRLENISMSSIDLSIFSGIQMEGVLVALDRQIMLKSLTVNRVDKFPKQVFFSITSTSLETIDHKLGDFLSRTPGVTIDISNSVRLLCNSLSWMTQVSCPERMIIRDATCSDKLNLPLEQYLKGISPDSKCLVEPAPTQTPTSTVTLTTQTDAPTTKGASSAADQISPILVITIAIFLIRSSVIN